MLDLILRWTHILSAIFLVGGTTFMRWSLVPALPTLGATEQAELTAAIRRRWSKVVMITSGLLLLSGLINAVRVILRYEFEGGIYHMLVALKLLLALAVFWIAAVLSGRSATAEKYRQRFDFWLNLNVVLGITIVLLGGVMRMEARAEKEDVSIQAAITAPVQPGTGKGSDG